MYDESMALDDEEIARLKLQATLKGDLEVEALKAAGVGDGARVLDMGCGPGFFARNLMDAPQWAGLEIHGVDLYREGQIHDLATTNLGAGRYQPHDVTSDEPIPFAGGFDVTYARLLLRHVAHPDRVIDKMKAATVKGGRVILIDADDGALQLHPPLHEFDIALRSTHDFVREHAPGAIPSPGPRLAVMAAAAGLKVEQVRVLALSMYLGSREQVRRMLRPFWQQHNNGMSAARCDALREALYAWADPKTPGLATWAMYFVGASVPK